MEGVEVDVVVIGGGISGLTAAYHLIKRCPTLSVLVLEAKDRVGGRTLTQEMNSAWGSDYWDLGGQWVGRSQTHIMDLICELGLETVRQYDTGKKYMQLGGNRIRSYTSNIPSLSLFALLDLHRLISKIEKYRKTVPMSDPYRCDNATKWDSMTLESFLQQNAWTKGARDSFHCATRCMLGVECCQISFLYYLMYCASGNGIENLIDTTEESAQGFTIKGGAQQISQKLVEKVHMKNVLINHPVASVQQDDDGVCVTCLNGATFQCKRLVISTPPHQTEKIIFNPPLPLNKREMFRRMPVSLLIKVIITYREAFWRKRGDSGEFVTNGGQIRSPGKTTGPVCVTYDATSASGNPAMVIFMGGYPAIEWSQEDSSSRKKAVLDSLYQVWGQAVHEFIDYQEKDWSEETYSEGSPVNCVAPGGMKYFVQGLRYPFLRVHFAGSESASVFCGYMNGAVQAGVRAATEILYNLYPELVSEAEREDTFYALEPLQRDDKDQAISSVGSAIKLSLSLGLLLSALFVGGNIVRHRYL